MKLSGSARDHAGREFREALAQPVGTSNAGRGVALPDLAWDEADHVSAVDESLVIGPWDIDRTTSLPPDAVLFPNTTRSISAAPEPFSAPVDPCAEQINQPFSAFDSEWNSLLSELEQVFVEMAILPPPRIVLAETQTGSEPANAPEDCSHTEDYSTVGYAADPSQSGRQVAPADPQLFGDVLGQSESATNTIPSVAGLDLWNSTLNSDARDPEPTPSRVTKADEDARTEIGVQVGPAIEYQEFSLSHFEDALANRGVDVAEIIDDDIETWTTNEGEASVEWPGDAADVDSIDFNESGPAQIDDSFGRGLFDLDLDARQVPWKSPAESNVDLRRARQRAASVVAVLDIASVRKREASIRYLTEFFVGAPGASTFRALLEAVELGLDMDTLRSMIALREYWREHPEWWLCRWAGSIRTIPEQQARLSWGLTWRICVARCDYEIESMIDDTWLDEWLGLSRHETGYASFAEYIAEKTLSSEEGLQVYMPPSYWLGDGAGEFGDDHGWYRSAAVSNEDVRRGFHVMTPWDERPGVIRPCPTRENVEG